MQNNENALFGNKLGVVVSGSLTHGIDVKLDGAASVEDMAVGRYVTIKGQKRRFFGMITDVTLGVVDEQINVSPSDASDPFLKEVLAGTSTFGSLHILPMLTIGGAAEGPQPVKTVPSHFCDVEEATQSDVEMIFGTEDDKKFYIGTPLDMETKICMDLPEFAKRSNGIFGKSGAWVCQHRSLLKLHPGVLEMLKRGGELLSRGAIVVFHQVVLAQPRGFRPF